jgi:hypothetical protein
MVSLIRELLKLVRWMEVLLIVSNWLEGRLVIYLNLIFSLHNWTIHWQRHWYYRKMMRGQAFPLEIGTETPGKMFKIIPFHNISIKGS